MRHAFVKISEWSIGLMVKIKAFQKLEEVHKTQANNYYKPYNEADGLLINFGVERLQYHRVFN